MLVLPLYLTAETQGYWFTFMSLAALAVLGDLGFTVIILQWSAHEFANLTFDENQRFCGSASGLARISSLFVFSINRSILMALIAFPIVFIIGFVVLDRNETSIGWHFPWLIYSATSVLIFLNNVTLSFFEGCNSVAKIQKLRFYIAVVSSVTTIAGVISGVGLYALAFGLLLSAVIGAVLIFSNYSSAIKQMLALHRLCDHPWKKELVPLLLRYAISWASGYFIFQIFTPAAFYFYGANEAGKVGLSFSAIVAIYSISNIWMTIIIPSMNICVAEGNYLKLNFLFKRNLKLAMLTYISGVSVLIICLVRFADFYGIGDRFVGLPALLVIVIAWFLQMIISAWAVYIRAHKQEPLVKASFVWALYTTVITLLIAINLPFKYFFYGFLSGYTLVVPWFYYIFKRYKREEVLQ